MQGGAFVYVINVCACRLYGQFTMETILATAFGRVVNIQRGEGDQLTEAAGIVFSGAQEGRGISGSYLTLVLSEWVLHSSRV